VKETKKGKFGMSLWRPSIYYDICLESCTRHDGA